MRLQLIFSFLIKMKITNRTLLLTLVVFTLLGWAQGGAPRINYTFYPKEYVRNDETQRVQWNVCCRYYFLLLPPLHFRMLPLNNYITHLYGSFSFPPTFLCLLPLIRFPQNNLEWSKAHMIDKTWTATHLAKITLPDVPEGERPEPIYFLANRGQHTNNAGRQAWTVWREDFGE